MKTELMDATKKAISDREKERLNRIDDYMQNVEHGIVAKQAQAQNNPDILIGENKEEQLKRLEDAIKNNLTGYDLEKEM